MSSGDRQAHWQGVHRSKSPEETSWFQLRPEPSLRLIDAAGLGGDTRMVDIGGGASTLVDHLLARGWQRITVLDIAEDALRRARERLGERAAAVTWEVADVTRWRPEQSFELWHDRAVFHFLTDAADRAAYRDTLAAALRPGGYAVVATFALDGPERCSGLPVVRYDSAALAAEFAGCLELVQSARDEHVTPGGKLQAFTFCLFRRR